MVHQTAGCRMFLTKLPAIAVGGAMFLVRKLHFQPDFSGDLLFLTLVPRSPSITVLGKTKTDGWIAWNHRPKHACMLPACSCSKERPWPFHFSISRMVEPKNGRIFGWHKETCEHTRSMNILRLPKFKISSDKLFLGSTLTKHFFGPRNCCFFSLSRFFLVEKKSYGIKSIGVGMAGPPVLGFVKKVVDDKRWVVILFFSSNSAFGGMCFFCWWISILFFPSKIMMKLKQSSSCWAKSCEWIYW